VAVDDENLKEETLFLAVTRPTMWLGVPIEASASTGTVDSV